MKKLILRKAKNCVVAIYLQDNRPESSIVELFGTHILPLPYSELADLNQVAIDISERNKEYTIEISHELEA